MNNEAELLNDPVYSAIVEAKINLMFYQPFFGQLASRLDVVLCEEDSWCYSAATDGKHLYFNRDFTSRLNRGQIMFVIAHEILHCLYDHLGRRGGRDPKLWNMANDYIVNYTLKDAGVGEMPSMGLYDSRFTDEMSSEEVYDVLKKNAVEIKMTLDQHLEENRWGEDEEDGTDGEQQQGGGGQPDDDDGDGGSGGDDEKQSGGGDQSDDGDGDGDGDGDEQNGNGGSGKGQQEVSVTVTGTNGPPKLSKEDIEELKTKMRAAAIQAAQTVGAGKVPSGVMRRLGDLIEPKLDWRALLDSHIRSALKDDYTFQRPSRNDFGGFIMPAQDVLEVVEVDVSVDTSGSMSERMLRDIFSEVKGIMQSFPDFVLRVWTFDTEVYGYKEFSPHNLHEIDNYAATAQGGGGTLFECNWEFMKQHDIQPHRLVLFTDGYPGRTWGDPNYCDTLFVVHGSRNIVAPFGRTAYYEEPDALVEAA